MSKTFDQFITESQEYYRYDFVDKNLNNGAAGYIEFVNKTVGGGRGKLVFQPTSSDYGFYGSQLKNDQKECVFRIYHQNNVRESASFVRIVWDIAAVYFLDSKKMQDDDKRLVWLPQPLKIKNMAIVNKSFVKFSALKESLQEAMSLKYEFVDSELVSGASAMVEFQHRHADGEWGKLAFKPQSLHYSQYGTQLSNNQRECVFRILEKISKGKYRISFMKVIWDKSVAYFLDYEKMGRNEKKFIWKNTGIPIKRMVIWNKSFVKFSALKESLQEAMSLKDAIKIVNPGDPYLRNMVKALSMHPFLNTKEENDRLEAAKLVLKNKSKLVYKGSKLGYAIKGE